MTTPARVLTGVAIAGAIGLLIFGLMAWRSVHFERVEVNEALRRFSDVRERFSGVEPILRVGPEGRIVRTREATAATQPPRRFYVLAYHAGGQRLVHADIPFWFLTVKGPAATFAVRGTGLDLDRLGVSPAELKRYGPTLVLDDVSADNSRLLVWTE